MQFTYSLIGRSTITPLSSLDLERPYALILIHFRYLWFQVAPPIGVNGGSNTLRRVNTPSLGVLEVATYDEVAYLKDIVNLHIALQLRHRVSLP